MEAAAQEADDRTPAKHSGGTLAAHCTGASIAIAIRALITPAQHDALAAHVAAEVAKARASEAAALERMTRLEKALNGCIAAIEHANMADGVCCCGDNMEGHSEPMNCGHSPVDMGEYHAHQVLTAARQALTPTADKE